MIIAPPIEPGMQDKPRFFILLSLAKLATFRSSVAAPPRILSLINFVYENSLPNLMTAPLIPLSLKATEPAPITVVFKFIFFAF